MTFNSRSVAYGLSLDEFSHIDQRTRRKLTRLMARVSEKSYRRGLQHGTVIDDFAVSPAKLRFETSVDRAPFADGGGCFTAEERLFMEYGELRLIGFRQPGGTSRGFSRMRHASTETKALKEKPQ